ncbi:MAG: S1-like domain-containing RNA-binding protein [Tissierellia bacterium]|nr:S1-like domain-containing RNA-binding protein [Tissierellia bacterium]
MNIGKTNKLKVERLKSQGVYLIDEQSGEEVLLPKKYVDKNVDIGDELEVFVYKDSEDRPIATTEKPFMEVGDIGHLEAKAKTNIGYFFDLGLEKEVLLPFSESRGIIEVGKTYLVKLYVDKSNRLAITQDIKSSLLKKSPYRENDNVTGSVYGISDEYGVFVAIDEKYDALLPKREVKGIFDIGETIEARVARIDKAGRMTLSLRDRAYIQINKDAEKILDILEDNGGEIPIGDKSHPEKIKDMVHMTKSAFKRAVGKLYKEGDVIPGDFKTRIKR